MKWKLLTFAFSFGVVLSLVQVTREAKQSGGISLIIRLDDFKDFKKLLRTKTNLLVIFSKSEKYFTKSSSLFGTVAQNMKGKATLALIECGEAKKLCKKMKASPPELEMKHYKDGEFNKDYDRKMEVKSMVNFLTDPTGDIPWEEDSTAKDVIHIDDPSGFKKLLKKEKLPLLVMFYAPWCGFCKKLKPDFAAAATELKGDYVLVGIDVDKPHQMQLRVDYNITGFPTLYYFVNGKMKYKYGGENTKDGIISWMNKSEYFSEADLQSPSKNSEVTSAGPGRHNRPSRPHSLSLIQTCSPTEAQEPKSEPQWSDETDEITFLGDDTFEDFIENNPSVLIMFYAPWCGHCKKMKPEFEEAAKTMKDEGIKGVLAGIDATLNKKLAEEYKIQGFPTVKYFSDGKFAFDFNERTADKIVDFMKDPKEPPPPPPPEPRWDEIESDVHHLTDDSFKSFLKKKKHVLVMFYAPWCGHCKKAKPEFMASASKYQDDTKVCFMNGKVARSLVINFNSFNQVAFAAVDCTVHVPTCTDHEVTGYPTFKYFNYGKNSKSYMGGREENDFVKFMQDPLNTGASEGTAAAKSPDEDWKEIVGYENIQYLTDTNFDSVIRKENSVLVMFYAPWCGHCKAMKPAYGEAATKMKTAGVPGALAALDATSYPGIAGRFEVKGYPTIKYFKNGKFEYDYSGARTTENLVSFMKSPKAPAPPPPPEPAWSSIPSAVNHLSQGNFTTFLKEKQNVLVMFYAPWCGHCKKAKPEFQSAADALKGEQIGHLAAVDCTSSKDICTKEGVNSYPQFKMYKNGEKLTDYNGGRKEADFVQFLKKPVITPSKEEL